MDAINRYTSSPIASGSIPARAAVPKQADEAKKPPLQDKVEFSKDEQKRIKEQALKERQQKLEADQDAMREQMESAEMQAEATSKQMETQGKCLIIAGRILAGDTVPQADQRFLAQNSPELYAQAITMRIQRSDPRKHKSISEEDKADEIGAAQQSPSVDAPPAEGGGEGGGEVAATPESPEGGSTQPEA